MRVVLDTNVIASGLFFSGLPSRILDEVFSGRVTVVLTAEIIAEYARVVEQLGKRYSCADAAALLDQIVRLGEVVSRSTCSAPSAPTPTMTSSSRAPCPERRS